MVGSFAPQPPEFSVSGLGSTPKPFHLITNAAALRLGRFLRHSFVSHRHHFGSIIHSPLKNFPHLGHVLQLNRMSHGRSHQFNWFKLPQWPHDSWATAFSSCILFFGGEGSRTNYGDQETAYLRTPTRGPVNKRILTDILLAINVLVYVAQIASKGKLFMWGAKVNSLIDKGELWRLVTSSFLHANVGHLMINCYSLNSIGPTMEHLSGPRRYLAIYMTSAIASSTMSYWLSKAPAVGASGAIFGLVSFERLNQHVVFLVAYYFSSFIFIYIIVCLHTPFFCAQDGGSSGKLFTRLLMNQVGSFAIFVLRHNDMVKGGVGDLKHVARVIALNMAIGLLSQGIDNWGHLGGLIGGIATSWLIGPAWKFESTSRHGRQILVDKAPIFSLPGTKRGSQ